MLIEGEEETGQEGGGSGGGHSCNLFKKLDWQVRVDTLMGLIYATDRWVYLSSVVLAALSWSLCHRP